MSTWSLVAVVESNSIAVPLACALLPTLFFLPGLFTGLTMIGRRHYVANAGVATVTCWAALACCLATGILAAFTVTAKADVEFLRSLVNLGAVVGWSAAIVGLTTGALGFVESLRRRQRDLAELRGGTASLLSAIGSTLVVVVGVCGAFRFGGSYVDRAQTAAATTAGNPAVAASSSDAKQVTAMRPVIVDGSVSATQFAGRATVDPPKTDWLGQLVPKSNASPNDGPSSLEFKALNLRFRKPGNDWFRIDAPTANAASQLAYVKADQSLQFILIAEQTGVESPFATEDLLEVARTHQRDGLSSVQFEAPREYELAGIPGQLLASTYRQGLLRYSTQLWAAVHNGFAYQLFVLGASDSPEKIRDAALTMFANFESLDPAAIAHTAPFSAAAGFRNLAPYGCTIDLRDTPWRAWNEHTSQMIAAEYGARIDPQTLLFVVPIVCGVTPVDRNGAAAALFSMAGLAYSQALQGERKPVQQGKLTGEQWQWRGSGTAGETHCLARVYVAKQCVYLLAGICPIDRADRLTALQQALDAVRIEDDAPLASNAAGESRRRLNTATFYNELGLYHFARSEWPDAVRWMQAARSLLPGEPTYLGNLVEIYLRQERAAEALALLESAGRLVTDRLDLRAKQSRLLAQTGRIDDACREYAALFAAGYRDDAELQRYVELLGEAGRHATARLAIADYRRAGDSSTLVVVAAGVMRRAADVAGAVALLEQRLAHSPQDEDVAYELVIAYRKLERFRDALKLVDTRLLVGNDPVSAYYWKGLLEYDLQQFRPAKTALEKAHRLNPDNTTVKSLLDYVTAALGEGENLRIKTPIEAVPLPQAVVAARPTGPASDELLAAAASYADRTTVYRFEAGEELTRTEYYVINIHNEQGVVQFNTITVQFDPLSEEIYVNRLEVFDERGKRAAAGEPSNYYVLDDSTQSVAVHDKILEMPVPGLHPGCRVELVITVRRLSPPLQLPYFEHVFGMSYPCRRQAVVFVGDQDVPASAGSLAVDVRRDAECLWWQVVDRPAYRAEQYAPNATDSEPSLFLADRRTNWADESREYLEAVADRLTTPDVIRRTAEEQTRGLTTRAAKIAALADFVRRTVSYKAVEFGRRSRIMHPADQTLAACYGDCKDMSLLLAQLLSAAGVAAHPALIHSQNPLQESLGTLDQFDHMIVYAPDDAEPWTVDPTDRYADPRLPLPMSFAGKKLFVLDGERSHVAELPQLDADSYRADIRRRVSYDAAGTAHVDETITFSGYYAAGMRGYFSYFSAENRQAQWQSYLESGGVAPIVRKFAIDDLDHRDRPLVVKTQYDVERALLPAGAGRLGTIPAPLELMIFSPQTIERRRLPIELRYPMRIRTETLIESPPECDLPETTSFTGDARCDLFSCRATAGLSDGELKLTAEVERISGRRPAEFYDEFCRSARAVRHVAAPVVFFPGK